MTSHAEGASGEWRPLGPREVDLLKALAATTSGAPALVAQIAHASARSGCSCGCGTIELTLERDVAASAELATPSGVVAEAQVLDHADEPIGGLLLWVEDGYISGIEVYDYDEPLPLPGLDRVRITTERR